MFKVSSHAGGPKNETFMRPRSTALFTVAMLALGFADINPSIADPQLLQFRTPSSNIYCQIAVGGMNERTGVACDIGDRSGNPPIQPKPNDCDYDWGYRFSLGSSSDAGLECGSDSLKSEAGFVLEYNDTVSVNGISCRSSETGLECLNRRGQGFHLSRRVQRLF